MQGEEGGRRAGGARRLLVRQHRSLDTDPADAPEPGEGTAEEEEVRLSMQKLEL